ASWLTLSSDKKRLIGVAAFSRAYDISGVVASCDAAARTLCVRAGPDTRVELPVAADAKVLLAGGEGATLADVKKHGRVLIKRSPDGKAIVGIVVATSDGYEVPLPQPSGK